eukprot:TRINITY_DN75137_c0_g1_i1.p1 TRINITY_DN75137_c0_g1~~TRINITY_DN75137_c0_g1_i1.p1  ORF type:complete len:1047 (-),score=176.65 TRINITY_DN75137_c0_g1_i1:72-3212(-)
MVYRRGEVIGEYEVQRLLGRGAHGTVLKVRGPGPCQQLHAMKLLHCDGPPMLGGEARRARDTAFAEAAMLKRLRHPHVVGCRDVTWDGDRQAVRLLLEYMDGGDLQGVIEGQRSNDQCELFEAHFARRVLAAVGSALAYIHAAGVLHRDVKPANVLLTQNSQRIKLADFGIAKLLEHTSHARTVVGTPYYLSPEIVAGQAYGEASDAWALGVCLFEVAALRRPFDAGNQLALVRLICTEPHDALPDGVADDVRRATEGLLVKESRSRMTLQQALSISASVAALAVPGLPPEDARRGRLSPPPRTPSSAASTVGCGFGGTFGGVGDRKGPVLDPEALSVAVRASPTGSCASELAYSSSFLELTTAAEAALAEGNSFGGAVGGGTFGGPSGSFGGNIGRDADRLGGHVGADTHVAVGDSAVSSIPGGPGEGDRGRDSEPTVGGDRNGCTGVRGRRFTRTAAAAWLGSEAAAAARDALSDEVDDPEELVGALAALEREREQQLGQAQSSEGAAALEALEKEVRLRLAALRDDAAAMLDGLWDASIDGAEDAATGGGGTSHGSGGGCTGCSDVEEEESFPTRPGDADARLATPTTSQRGGTPRCCSEDSTSRCGSKAQAADVEHALEVATSLGVDTDQSEERIAHKRGMLSLRVKWGTLARFCMLPVTVGFDSLVAEVSRRFGLSSSTSLPPLSWCEAGESFELKNQAGWEECLQRRGLVAQPGRLEICVRSEEPPPRPAHLFRVPRPYVAPTAFSATLRRPELFTWRVSSERLQQAGAAVGAGHAGSSSLGASTRRSFGRSWGRTPVARSSSRCREAPGAVSSSAVPSACMVGPMPPPSSASMAPSPSAYPAECWGLDEDDLEVAKKVTSVGQTIDLADTAGLHEASRGLGTMAHSHGIHGGHASALRGMVDCSRSSPTGDREHSSQPSLHGSSQLHGPGVVRGYGLECARSSPSPTAEPSPHGAAALAIHGRDIGFRVQPRSRQPHQAIPRCRTAAAPTTVEGRGAKAAASLAGVPMTAVPSSMTASSVGIGLGGSLPQVNGRAVMRQ